MRRARPLVPMAAITLLALTGCSGDAAPDTDTVAQASSSTGGDAGASSPDGIAAAPEQEITTTEDGRLRVIVTIGEERTTFAQSDGVWQDEDIERMHLLILSTHGFWTGLYDGPEGAGEVNRPEDTKTLCNPDSSYLYDADCTTGISYDPAGWIDGADDARCSLFIQYEGVFGYGERFWFVDADGNRYLEDATYDEVTAQGVSGLPCNGAAPTS